MLLEPAVLETISRFRQDAKNKPEAGGILLGFRRGPHLHVVEATTPTQHDRRWRTGFERSEMPHQRTALDRWYVSGGTMDYLGEWHTHPQPEPTPSGVDIAAWKRINRLHPDRAFVFAIAGNTDHYWFGVAKGLNMHHLSMGGGVMDREFLHG